jgi:hypothetical protein
VVIRDWEGNLKLTGWCVILHCRDAEVAEAIECQEGVLMAQRWPDLPMILESDCPSMVSKLQTNPQDRSVMWQVIEQTRDVGGQLCTVDVVKISRVKNTLAQLSITSKECQTFFSCFPEWVMSLSSKDVT